MQKPVQPLRMSSLRLEALGDGIFAVAMTILVIELHVPELNNVSWHEFLEKLGDTWQGLLCYVISFVVLGIMWFGHRMMFEYIARTNRYFIFLGILFYMVACLVPFSTRFLASHIHWSSILVYGLNLSLCNLTLYAQWLYGINRPSLLEMELPTEVRKEARNLFLLSPVVYAIAIIISFWAPVVSLVIYAITPVLYLLPNKLDKYMP